MIPLETNKIISKPLTWHVLVCAFVLLGNSVTAQFTSREIKQIDSLKKVTFSAKNDTNKIKAMRAWDDLIFIAYPDLDFKLNKQIDSICTVHLKKNLNQKERKFYLREKAAALNIIGLTYTEAGKYEKAIEYHLVSLKIQTDLGNKKGIAASVNNLGECYRAQGNFAKAIEYFTKSLQMYESLNNQNGLSATFGNIGLVYKQQGDYQKALTYAIKGLELRQLVKDYQGVILSLNEVGNLYKNLTEHLDSIQDRDSIQSLCKVAHSYLEKAKKLAIEVGDQKHLAHTLNNMGLLFIQEKQYELALQCYINNLEIQMKINDNNGKGLAYSNIGFLYNEMGQLEKASKYCYQALELAKESESISLISNVSRNLYKINKKLGRHKEALVMYEWYQLTLDSINKEENAKAIIRQEYKYQYEKQAAQDSVANAKQQEIKNVAIAKQKAEIKAKRNQQYLLFGGLGLVLIFAIFMFNRFRVTALQKKEIERQKHLVDEKQKEILDSIHYAKRIQSAILPSEKYISKSLKNK